MSSGGITNRSGGNTQEIYSTESSAPQQPITQQSTGRSWLGKAWDWAKEHAKGIGKVANAAATIGAAAIGPSALAGFEAVKAGAGLLKDELKGTKAGKFVSGFTNEDVSSKANKAYDTLTNKGLDKTGKFLALANQLKSYKPLTNNNVSNTSNGHVPTGYQPSSEPVIPAGLMKANTIKPKTKRQEWKAKKRNKGKKNK